MGIALFLERLRTSGRVLVTVTANFKCVRPVSSAEEQRTSASVLLGEFYFILFSPVSGPISTAGDEMFFPRDLIQLKNEPADESDAARCEILAPHSQSTAKLA